MEGDEAGARLVVEGGDVVTDEAAAAPVGTAITVEKLFFNTPVRAKFLRSDAAEAAQITELIQRLAVAHSRVTFRLTQEGRETVLSPGSADPLNALIAVWGRPVARDLLRVEGGSRLSALGSRPEDTLRDESSREAAPPTQSPEPGARAGAKRLV